MNKNNNLDLQENIEVLDTNTSLENDNIKPKNKDKNKSKKAKDEQNSPVQTVYEFETLKFSIEEIINDLIKTNTLDIEKIPNIDLYVDQLTTFIEENLFSNKPNQLTKSMVNNYCKNKVIPAAEKKKYTKTHILLLIIMYNTKTVLSLPDIEKIFKSFDDTDIVNYYNYVTEVMENTNKLLNENTLGSYTDIHNSPFSDKPKAELALLATKLAMEANVKKMLAEIIIEKYL